MSKVCFIFLFYRKCNRNEKNIFEEKCWFTKIGQGSFWICDVYIVLWWCCLGSLYGRWHCVWVVCLIFFSLEICLYVSSFCTFLFIYRYCHQSCVEKCWMNCDNKRNMQWHLTSGSVIKGNWCRTWGKCKWKCGKDKTGIVIKVVAFSCHFFLHWSNTIAT